MKRYGEPRRETQIYTRRPGVYAILPRDGKLLVTFQAADHQEFQLPGGGVDPGEPNLTALHREVFEETGWRIGAPMRLGCFKRFAYMPEYDLWAEKICHIYVARPVRKISDPTEDHHSAHWITPEDAAFVLGNSGDRAAIHQFILD